jgi:hypothetical protein
VDDVTTSTPYRLKKRRILLLTAWLQPISFSAIAQLFPTSAGLNSLVYLLVALTAASLYSENRIDAYGSWEKLLGSGTVLCCLMRFLLSLIPLSPPVSLAIRICFFSVMLGCLAMIERRRRGEWPGKSQWMDLPMAFSCLGGRGPDL